MSFKRGGHIGIQGWFNSLKLRRDVRYLNPLQRDLLYFLEFDTAVQRYQEQPFVLRTTLDDGTYHEHTPAFQVEINSRDNNDGESHVLVECAYQARLETPVVKAALDASAEWAGEHGYRLVVATDQDLATAHYLANIRLLWRYSRITVPPLVVAECREFLAALPQGAPFRALRQHLDTTCTAALHDGERQHTAPPFMYNLLFRHILFTHLGPPLDANSMLRLRPPTGPSVVPTPLAPTLGTLDSIAQTRIHADADLPALLLAGQNVDRRQGQLPGPERSQLWPG